ncbi:MAG TPA: group 1 truncated hemoglobin [Chitinophagaceae bacterium]|jgi:hypothetical protein
MKKTVFLSVTLGLIVTAISVGSCSKSSSNSTPTPPTLYDSLGGTAMVTDPTNTSVKIEAGRLGIRSVIDSTIYVIAADAKINGHFKVLLTEVGMGNTSGFTALSKNLTDFVAVATGAKDYTYGGKSMVAAHDPAQNSRMTNKATSADFDAFVADLVTGANKNKVPSNLITSIGALVNTLRSQVVQM